VQVISTVLKLLRVVSRVAENPPVETPAEAPAEAPQEEAPTEASKVTEFAPGIHVDEDGRKVDPQENS
jgi:hypothetical protein